MLEVAAAHRHEPAEKIVEAVGLDVRSFSRGAPADDDRTLVVVRYPEVAVDA